jgi:COP9 signalosome complex subunit 8
MDNNQDPTRVLEHRVNALCLSSESDIDLRKVVSFCEELELMTLSSRIHPMDASYYAIFLAALLAVRELDQARHLWKRMPQTMKDQNSLLHQMWQVGQALWKHDIVEAHAVLATLMMQDDHTRGTPPTVIQVSRVVAALKKALVESTAALIRRAYTSISLHAVSQALGHTCLEDTIQCNERYRIICRFNANRPTTTRHAYR